jgi:hypothetical protein
MIENEDRFRKSPNPTGARAGKEHSDNDAEDQNVGRATSSFYEVMESTDSKNKLKDESMKERKNEGPAA